jgi:N-carbamoyl-L-amino-acid hydrolase
MIRQHLAPERYLDDQRALRRFGAAGGGVVRPAFSEPDMAARRWLAGRFADAGLRPVFDPVGNLFGLPPGEERCVLVGSHSDSQPEGGWLDGAYGVISGLEVARAARAAGVPVGVVSFQDEEGRFGGLVGSGVATGRISLADAKHLTDAAGITLAQARAATFPEWSGCELVDLSRFTAYLEPHIEQGPVLDAAGETIGVVRAIAGLCQAHVTLRGVQNHAGTTPMGLRRDAVMGFLDAACDIRTEFNRLKGAETVFTIGQVHVRPNAPSIVPGEVHFTLQVRDPQARLLDALMERAHKAISEVAAGGGFEFEFSRTMTLPPVAMDARIVSALSSAASVCAPGVWRVMTSGALHDATNMATRMPSGMLFVPSIGGVSHSFAEDTAAADLLVGLEVLAETVSTLSATAG